MDKHQLFPLQPPTQANVRLFLSLDSSLPLNWDTVAHDSPDAFRCLLLRFSGLCLSVMGPSALSDWKILLHSREGNGSLSDHQGARSCDMEALKVGQWETGERDRQINPFSFFLPWTVAACSPSLPHGDSLLCLGCFS